MAYRNCEILSLLKFGLYTPFVTLDPKSFPYSSVVLAIVMESYTQSLNQKQN